MENYKDPEYLMRAHKSPRVIKKSPRILMSNLSGRGGHSQHCYCLCNALASKLELVYLVPRKYESKSLPHPFTCERTLEQIYDKKTILKGLIHLKNLRTIYRAALYNKVQVYHLHDIKIATAELKLLEKLHQADIKVVYTAHNILHHEKRSSSAALSRFYKKVDAIIVHAEANKEELLRTFELDPAKISVIPVGSYSSYYVLDDSEITLDKNYMRQELGLPGDTLLLLLFGHIRKYKGLDIMLQAMRMLANKNKRIDLAIVGEPVGSFSEYQKQIDTLPYPEWVHPRLEYVSTELASKYVLASDVIVMPYRHIYQSGVVYLAYAHARPVIATQVGGLPEVVDDGRTGLLVEAENPQALADAIERFLDQPKLIELLGKHAYHLSKTSSAWDWQKIADKTVEVYRQALAGQP